MAKVGREISRMQFPDGAVARFAERGYDAGTSGLPVQFFAAGTCGDERELISLSSFGFRDGLPGNLSAFVLAVAWALKNERDLWLPPGDYVFNAPLEN